MSESLIYIMLQQAEVCEEYEKIAMKTVKAHGWEAWREAATFLLAEIYEESSVNNK
jgi:hypothetical protein